MQNPNTKVRLLLFQCVDNACKLIAHGKCPDAKPINEVELTVIDDNMQQEYFMQPVINLHLFEDEDEME